MTIQFSNNPGISVRIRTDDLYRFTGSAQYGKITEQNFVISEQTQEKTSDGTRIKDRSTKL